MRSSFSPYSPARLRYCVAGPALRLLQANADPGATPVASALLGLLAIQTLQMLRDLVVAEPIADREVLLVAPPYVLPTEVGREHFGVLLEHAVVADEVGQRVHGGAVLVGLHLHRLREGL